jgi:hypothetical protein
MPSCGMLRRVAHVRTYVSEECSASIIRVKKSVNWEKLNRNISSHRASVVRYG